MISIKQHLFARALEPQNNDSRFSVQKHSFAQCSQIGRLNLSKAEWRQGEIASRGKLSEPAYSFCETSLRATKISARSHFDLDTGASSKWLQAYKLPHSAQQGSLHVMVTQNFWTNSGREVVSSPLPTDMGPHINGLPN